MPIPASLKARSWPLLFLFRRSHRPACPIRRPGGAVAPAMNPATGFLQFALIHSAPLPQPTLRFRPIIIIPVVSGSAANILIISRCDVPLTGSPRSPQVDCPAPRHVSCHTLHSQRPLRDTTPMLPALVNVIEAQSSFRQPPCESFPHPASRLPGQLANQPRSLPSMAALHFDQH